MSQSNVDALGWKAGFWGWFRDPGFFYLVATPCPRALESPVQLMDGEKDYREDIPFFNLVSPEIKCITFAHNLLARAGLTAPP